MINVNLHPEGRKSRKKSGTGPRFEMPDLGGFGGLDALRNDPWRTGMFVSVIVISLGILGAWYMQRATADRLDARLESAVADSTRLADLRSLSDSLRAHRQQIRERIALIETLDGDRFVWPHLIDQISRALPEVAWITRIEKVRPLPTLQLRVEAATTSPMAITEFARALERSSHVGSVRIMNSHRRSGDRATHDFQLSVRYEQPTEMVETAPLIAGGS